MGNEESHAQKQQAQLASNPNGQPNIDQQKQQQQQQQLLQVQQQQDYDGIKALHPLVLRVLMKEEFPNDIHIDSANLPLTYQMVQQYFNQINQTIAQNEEQLTVHTKRQLKEYIDLASLLNRRKNELEGKLATFLSLFRQLQESVNSASDLLHDAIKKADELAQKIDPTLSFNEFK